MIRAKLTGLYNTWLRQRAAKRLKPLNAIAFMTYRCTNRCATCNIWQRTEGRVDAFKAKELSMQAWDRIIEKLSHARVHSLEIFGGDALLRQDVVFPLIEKCTDLGIETYLPTNCNLLDESVAVRLVTAGLGTVYFSIDGIEGLQDTIRGNTNAHTNTVQAVRYIHDAKKKLGKTKPLMVILTTVSNMNVDRIEPLLNEFKKYPIDFVLLRGMAEVSEDDVEGSVIDGIAATPFFTSTVETSNLLSDKQADDFKALLRKLHRERTSWPFFLHYSCAASLSKQTYTQGIYLDYPCHLCTTVVTLTPSGQVVPCLFFTDYILGDLNHETSLEAIWGNDKHLAFIKKQREKGLAVCRKCCIRHSYPGVEEKIRQVINPYLDHLNGKRWGGS